MLQLLNKKVVSVLAPLSMGLSVSALAAGAAPANQTTTTSAVSSPFNDSNSAKAFFIIEGGVFTKTTTKTVTKGDGAVLSTIRAVPLDPNPYQAFLSKLDSNTTTTDIEKASSHPGGMELGILSKSWGILANVTPEATGLVGAGYAVLPAQYIGLGYVLDGHSNPSVGTKAMVGLVGYHVLPLSQQQRFTVLWVLGQVNTRGRDELTLPGLADSGIAVQTSNFAYTGTGTYLSLNVRYNVQITDNVAFSPSLEYRRTAVETKFSGLPAGLSSLKAETTETALEVAPLAITLNL